MKVLGVDTETTGLDPKVEWVVEVGAVMFDEDWNAGEAISFLINRPEVFPLKCQEIHHISEEELKIKGVAPQEAFKKLQALAEQADYIVAHNAKFDCEMLMENFKRTPEFKLSPEFLKKIWLCSKDDLKANEGKKCTKLSHLAVDHGLMFDPKTLHRAMDDVVLMGSMLKASGAKASEMAQYKLEPWIYLAAQVSFQNKQLAKDDGYGWETAPGTYNPKFPKQWIKRVKQKDLAAEKARDPGFRRLTVKD